MARIVLEGADEFLARLQAVHDFDPKPALTRAAESLLDLIWPGVPYLYGDLQRSGEVRGTNLYWDDLPYAGIQEARAQFFGPIAVAELPGLVEGELKMALDAAVGGSDG